jgi:hypothetical protein
MIKANRDNGITARILADSISPEGHRMTSMELEYPRFILAELNTHRMLSKNSASSRAIPISTMHKNIVESPATPVYWGKNQPGMSAKEEVAPDVMEFAGELWAKGMYEAIEIAAKLSSIGLHKQIANRITEPWMMMKTVISGTEWANLLYLRNHPDAQPEFAALAECIQDVLDLSSPTELQPGEWHLPYVDLYRSHLDNILYYIGPSGENLSIENARILSASCCAQVSYRRNDNSMDKAKMIYDKLINSTPAHASPVEHQATPMHPTNWETEPAYWQEGVSHMSANGDLWSGNLRGWIQFRKLIPNEAVW